MAHDTTPPRNKMILVFTLLSPAFLIALVPLFHDYFLDMTEGEVAARVAAAPPTIRDAIFAAQRQHLETGPMPIERAMREMASRGRDASPVIAPTPSDDTAAVSGWGPMEDAAAVAAAVAAHERVHRPPSPPPAPVVPSGVVPGGVLPAVLPPVPAP